MDYYIEKENSIMKEYGIEFFLAEKKNIGKIARSHIHPSLEFIYIKEGVFEIGIDNQTVIAKKGDFLIFRANVIHTITLIENIIGTYYVLKVAPTLLFQIFVGKNQLAYTMPFLQKHSQDISYISSKDIPAEIKRIWDIMIIEFSKNESDLCVYQRIHASELLLQLSRHFCSYFNTDSLSKELNEHTVNLIYESISFINKNFASDITALSCAEHIHVSYSYFARLFKAVTGKTFKEYLNTIRLSKARDALLQTDIPVTDVAMSCGFNSPSYFTAEYKKIYGKTPHQTKKEAPLYRYSKINDF